jgi:DNA-binding transcriptional ArsR family regulator
MRAEAATTNKMPIGRSADDEASLKKLAKQAGEAAQLLKLLGHEKRLLVLCFLAVRGEMTAGELVGVAKLSQSALSQHLAKLRSLNLVETRRDRQMIYYSCKSESARRLLHTLEGIFENN